MKTKASLTAALLALPLLGAAFLAAPAHSAPALGAPPAPGTDPEFREKFKKLMEKPQKGEMEKLVKSDTSAAAAWIARATEILAERPDDPEMVPFLTQLSAAWKTAMKSEFPEREKAYFAALEGRNKEDRPDLRRRFDTAESEFDANAEKKDGWVYTQLVDELEVLASAFDQIGDHYMSSEAWLLYAACFDEAQRGAAADNKRAFEGFERAISERKKVDLADAKKEAAEKRMDALSGKLAEAGDGGARKDPTENEPTDAGASVTVPLEFSVLPSIDAYVRPNWRADEHTITWLEIGLKGKGSTATFPNTPGAPVLHRVGSAELRFDSDGDGNAEGEDDEKIPLTGNITPVRIQLGQGENARPWAFFAVTATDRETYQEVSMNMSPSDDIFRLFTLGAASVTGTLDGTPIRIIDDSMDGVYGTDPQAYGFAGITRGVYQPDIDSIVIGSSKRARPWSQYQSVNGKWWKLEMGSEGGKILASPVRTDTGVLKLEYKGPIQPTWLIVRGTNALKNAFFDLVEGGSKGVEVPVGRYTLCYGEMRKGKKRQLQKCAILPGPHATINYDVNKGGTTVVTLGAPYTFAFDHKVADGKLTVTGQTVRVVGSAGEQYERNWRCVPHPEVSWRKKGTKSGSPGVKMPIVQDNDMIAKMGWETAWFPLDLVLDTKGHDDVEVHLVDKKHELFGKVESEWK